MHISLDMSEIYQLRAGLIAIGQPEAVRRAGTRGFRRIKNIAVREAKNNAPISPTKAQYTASLKGGKSERSDFHPGGLTRSITGTSGPDFAEIFVPSNSVAGAYARFIHNGEYDRGPGTRAKGAQADRLYIERAIIPNKEKFRQILSDELQKELLETFRRVLGSIKT